MLVPFFLNLVSQISSGETNGSSSFIRPVSSSFSAASLNVDRSPNAKSLSGITGLRFLALGNGNLSSRTNNGHSLTFQDGTNGFVLPNELSSGAHSAFQPVTGLMQDLHFGLLYGLRHAQHNDSSFASFLAGITNHLLSYLCSISIRNAALQARCHRCGRPLSSSTPLRSST